MNGQPYNSSVPHEPEPDVWEPVIICLVSLEGLPTRTHSPVLVLPALLLPARPQPCFIYEDAF